MDQKRGKLSLSFSVRFTVIKAFSFWLKDFATCFASSCSLSGAGPLAETSDWLESNLSASFAVPNIGSSSVRLVRTALSTLRCVCLGTFAEAARWENHIPETHLSDVSLAVICLVFFNLIDEPNCAPRCWLLCVFDGRCHPSITRTEPPSQGHVARNGSEDVPSGPYGFSSLAWAYSWTCAQERHLLASRHDAWRSS